VKRYVSLRFSRSWTSPIHGSAPADLGNSQVQFLLGECENGTHVLLLPVFDGDDRCTIGGDEEGFFFQFKGALPGSRSDRLRAALCTWGSDPYELIRQSIGYLAKALNSFRTRTEKRKPQFTEYLGWCTWDAFYFDVTEKGILKGLQTFAKGGVQPGFVIIDDGWFDAEGLYYMKSFAENRTKLPNGLSGVVQRAKETYGVKHIGVWHALMAYWGGVQKNGPLSKRYRLIPNRGNVRPWDKTGDANIYLVHPDDIARFYNEFYRWLRSSGIDKAMVDGRACRKIGYDSASGLQTLSLVPGRPHDILVCP